MSAQQATVQEDRELHPRANGSMPNPLSDGRQVFMDGELVLHPGASPAFAGALEVMRGYDELVSYGAENNFRDEANGQIPLSLLAPKNRSELVSKRHHYKAIADLSFGMLGRTPDFMNAAIMSMGVHNAKLSSNSYVSFSENAKLYYRHCLKRKPFVGHGAINPQIDRGIQLSEQNHEFVGVKVISTDADGITVSGAKMILTLAAIADELLIFNMPGLRSGDEDFALAFAIPTNAPGVKIYCRKGFQRKSYTSFDLPLSNTFDEIDSYLILERVKVSWDRVFVFRDVAQSNAFYDAGHLRHHTGHQGIARGLSKIEFAAGVAKKLVEVFGDENNFETQRQLGEIATSMEIITALVERSENAGYLSDAGIWTPNINAIQSVRLAFPRAYEAILKFIRTVAPGSMMAIPSEADFSAPHGAVLSKSFASEKHTAEERARLLNLAWNLCGDGFGQRQLLYEIYHAGDPNLIARGQYRAHDWSNCVASANRGLEL